MAKKKLASWLSAFIDVDGTQIAIEVKRLKIDAFIAFEKEFKKYWIGLPGDASGEDVVRAADAMLTWAKDTLTKYVRVAEDELEGEDGAPVRTGAELYEALGGANIQTIMEACTQVWAQNRLPEDVRKNLRSLSGSATTSAGPSPEAPGPIPAPTVESAEPQGSAPIADAGPEATPTPSGETTAS